MATSERSMEMNTAANQESTTANTATTSGGAVTTTTTNSTLSVSTTTEASPFYYGLFDDREDDAKSVRSYTDGVDVLSPVDSPRNFFQWGKLKSGRIVTSRLFKRSVLGAIAFTCVLLGIEASIKGNSMDPDGTVIPFLDGIMKVFQILFSIEIVLQFLYLQQDFIHKGWFNYDLFCVVLSFSIRRPEVLILRGFKLLRALRRASYLSDLRLVVRSVLKALPKLGAVTLLLGAQLFIFGVLCTHLFGDVSRDYVENFQSLDQTLWSLIRIMTLDDWSTIVEDVMVLYPWSGLLFLFFLLSTTLLLGSLVVAIVVQAVLATQREMILKPFQEGEKEESEATSAENRPSLYGDDLPLIVDKLERLAQLQEKMMASLHHQEINNK